MNTSLAWFLGEKRPQKPEMNFLTVNFVPPDKISRVNIAALRIKGQVHRRAVRSCVDKYSGSMFKFDIHSGLGGWLPSDQVGWDAKVHDLVKK